MIRVENVSKKYWNKHTGKEVQALDRVDFKISENEFVCLLGPSGCGKSTVLNLVAGFIRPTSGRILFTGREVSRPDSDRGVIFQDPTLFPWLTAQQNVEFGLINKGVYREERSQKAMEILRLVGLDGTCHMHPHELSGGMKQRVALARVLVLEPKALLMDEPFSALDNNTRERLQDQLLQIWESRKRPVLFVTHNADEAAYLADRVIIMGFPRESVRKILHVSLQRPRNRFSDRLREIANSFRKELSLLPCCIPVGGRELLNKESINY